MEFNTTNLGISLAILVIARWLYKAFYNFYLHPLAKIPGPWWAAVSYLPEMYYDLVEGGRYWTVVVEMHKNYGVARQHRIYLMGHRVDHNRSIGSLEP
jgi:hypothetical protein